MKLPVLKDIERWKSLDPSGRFSTFDYIFHTMRENKSNSDLYFAFLELFWPSFIVYKGYVLLQETFTEEKIEELIKKGSNVELWMNVFLVESYFDIEDEEHKPEFFAQALRELWEIKLKRDFPERNFVVEYICEDDLGDYGLTFYQKNKI